MRESINQVELLTTCEAKFANIMLRLNSNRDVDAIRYLDVMLNDMNRRLVSGDDVEIPSHLDTHEFREAWAEWIVYRETRKLGVAKIVLRKQLRALEFGDSDQAIDILGTAIEGNWKGIPDDIWNPTYRETWQGRLPANSDGTSEACESQFEAFWNAYPRRVNKSAAREAFARTFGLLRKTHSADECISIIMCGVDVYAKRVNPERMCHPATWLEGHRWEDDPDAIGPDRSVIKPSHSAFGTFDPKSDDPW